MATNTRKLASLLGASGAGIANDGTLTSAAIGDVIVSGDIADNAIDSEHYVDGSIDTAHVADDAITQAKIGADAVGTTELANDVAISTSGAITTTGVAAVGSASTSGSHLRVHQATTGTDALRITGGNAANADMVSILVDQATGSSFDFINCERDSDGTPASAFKVTGEGKIGIGTAAPTKQIHAVTSGGWLFSDTGANSKFTIEEESSNNSNSGIAIQKKYSSSAHTANRYYGDILFRGWDGDQFRNAATIEAVADGTPGNDDMPGKLLFGTNSGTTSQSTRLTLYADGVWGGPNSMYIIFGSKTLIGGSWTDLFFAEHTHVITVYGGRPPSTQGVAARQIATAYGGTANGSHWGSNNSVDFRYSNSGYKIQGYASTSAGINYFAIGYFGAKPYNL